jgi:acyl-coenzyme A synthetase/AMP-(fatty) acid ligase
VAVTTPLSFITGALGAFGIPLTGASGHLRDLTNADPSTIAAWVRSEQLTTLGSTPTVVGLIANAVLDHGGPVDSIRLAVHGGEVGTREHFASVAGRSRRPSSSTRTG